MSVGKNQRRHYMQVASWADIKAKYGWGYTAHNDLLPGQEVLVYKRKVPLFGSILYIPGMPDLSSEECKTFTDSCKNVLGKGVLVRIEQSQPFNEALLAQLKKQGWVKAPRHIQYRHTVIVDLRADLEEVRMNMKSRGRYEVGKSSKAGVVVEKQEINDSTLQKMYDLLTITSERNKFFIRDKEFMFDYWNSLSKYGQLRLYFALYKGDVLAAAMIIVSGDTAWYKDGGSIRTEANVMAPRLLHWNIIESLKAEGISFYDMGGIPDPEKHQTSSMHGIYVFKSAYAKDTTTFMPTLDLPLSGKAKLWPSLEKQWLRIYNLFKHSFWY